MVIYHTNDIHSDYAFLKKVSTHLACHRQPEDFYFDSGDYTDLKSVLVQADGGKAAMELMAFCGLDAMAVGNNEIDLGYDNLKALVESGVPMVCANLTDNAGNPVPGLPASQIMVRGGKRFLIIGTAPYYSVDMKPDAYNLFFEMGNLRTTDPIPAIRRELEHHRGAYDFCILLSHCGIYVDRVLEKQLPEVDLWLSGHSHTVFSGENYSSSGKGEFLGRVTLSDSPQVTESVQISLDDGENEAFDCLLREKEACADCILSEELEVVEELHFDPFRECELTNFLCDCLRKQFGGDLAMMHGGISEGSLLRPVSRKSLIENFPSKLNPTIYPISGEKLLDAIRLSLEDAHIRESGRGSGFRGHVLGNLGFSSNVRVTREPFAVTVDGEAIRPEQIYTLVTDDYLQRGTGYPSLQVPDDLCRYDKWFIRDMVQHFLTDPEVFASARIQRMEETI